MGRRGSPTGVAMLGSFQATATAGHGESAALRSGPAALHRSVPAVVAFHHQITGERASHQRILAPAQSVETGRRSRRLMQVQMLQIQTLFLQTVQFVLARCRIVDCIRIDRFLPLLLLLFHHFHFFFLRLHTHRHGRMRLLWLLWFFDRRRWRWIVVGLLLLLLLLLKESLLHWLEHGKNAADFPIGNAARWHCQGGGAQRRRRHLWSRRRRWRRIRIQTGCAVRSTIVVGQHDWLITSNEMEVIGFGRRCCCRRHHRTTDLCQFARFLSIAN